MKTEEYVLDYHQSQKLYNIGVNFIETHFNWVIKKVDVDSIHISIKTSKEIIEIKKKDDYYIIIPAPSCEDLMKLIPETMDYLENGYKYYYSLDIGKQNNKWFGTYLDNDGGDSLFTVFNKSFIKMIGTLLLHVKTEEGFIKLKGE